MVINTDGTNERYVSVGCQRPVGLSGGSTKINPCLLHTRILSRLRHTIKSGLLSLDPGTADKRGNSSFPLALSKQVEKWFGYVIIRSLSSSLNIVSYH